MKVPYYDSLRKIRALTSNREARYPNRAVGHVLREYLRGPDDSIEAAQERLLDRAKRERLCPGEVYAHAEADVRWLMTYCVPIERES